MKRQIGKPWGVRDRGAIDDKTETGEPQMRSQRQGSHRWEVRDRESEIGEP